MSSGDQGNTGKSVNGKTFNGLPEKVLPFPFLSSNALKVIALITMTIDHIGWVLVRTQPLWYILRIIGRFAFPIYVFLLVQGDSHTHSRKSYTLRLGLFALLSEIPFDLAEADRIWVPEDQNVFFTLLIGEIMLWLLAVIRERAGISRDMPRTMVLRQPLPALESLTVVIGCMMLSEMIHSDYGCAGVLLIAMVSFCTEWNLKSAAGVTLTAAAVWSHYWLQMIACLAFFIPVTLYNGERGRRSRILQYGFYVYYPVHLLILVMIRRYCL